MYKKPTTNIIVKSEKLKTSIFFERKFFINRVPTLGVGGLRVLLLRDLLSHKRQQYLRASSTL